ncbi:CACTA en-spm transposon protein [Cucumis melo var. makuwa]|uniref:CACTA en-spm transposon protein n=1 Tax=Cucumis melo var. makuwa TaxID=1194695 RepID=A0A5A7VDH8_CUCMM|nr:CACTA en-spm transposon protein [Cucumis melo var. makuwa]
MNRAARAKQLYNHNSGVESFLQRQHELAEQQGHPIDRMELFKKTRVRGGQFILPNQMLKLQSQPTLKGSQPLSMDEICETFLGRRSSYSKGLNAGPSPKSRHSTDSSSSTSRGREMVHVREVNELKAQF